MNRISIENYLITLDQVRPSALPVVYHFNRLRLHLEFNPT